MRNVFAAMFVAFVVLVVSFWAIGGSFDRQFWLAFFPGLMGNLTILAVAIFVIERIVRGGRIAKLKQTNESQSQFVRFEVNRLAFHVLKHLALATDEQFHNDPTLNFDFAFYALKEADVATVFYERMMESKDKSKFVGQFSQILEDGAKGISKALGDVYPRPDPALIRTSSGLNFSIGSLQALEALINAFYAANAQVGEDGKMKPEHLDVLIKVAYARIGVELQSVRDALIEIGEKAQADELFIALD